MLFIQVNAAWAVDREFVIFFLWGRGGPNGAPGSPDALGKQKHIFSVGFSRFEAINIYFP